MSSHPTPHNAETQELLSAYLDKQLSATERIALERRLRSEPALQRELEELQATIGVLHTLEPVAPPRSFTLDPAQVAHHNRGPFARLMGTQWVWVGGAVAALLVVAFTTVMMSASLLHTNTASVANNQGNADSSVLEGASGAAGLSPSQMRESPEEEAAPAAEAEIAEMADAAEAEIAEMADAAEEAAEAPPAEAEMADEDMAAAPPAAPRPTIAAAAPRPAQPAAPMNDTAMDEMDGSDESAGQAAGDEQESIARRPSIPPATTSPMPAMGLNEAEEAAPAAYPSPHRSPIQPPADDTDGASVRLERSPTAAHIAASPSALAARPAPMPTSTAAAAPAPATQQPGAAPTLPLALAGVVLVAAIIALALWLAQRRRTP